MILGFQQHAGAIVERAFHQWLIENHQPTDPRIVVGLGDDAAVVDFSGPVVITSDSIADGVHFGSTSHSLQEIGHKAIAVSLSDIAAMGAKPVAASVDMFVPDSFALEQLQTLFSAIAKTANRFDTSIIGGDTNRWPGQLLLSTTLYGLPACDDDTDGSSLWQISGGQSGDVICVTGPLGGSILGKHISFQPKNEFAIHLANNFKIHAATDITDSLVVDLALLARQSNCGFQLSAADIPIADAAKKLAEQSNESPLHHALYDGEDFELLFSLSESEFARCRDEESITKIGTLNDSGRFEIVESNQVKELEIRGYEH